MEGEREGKRSEGGFWVLGMKLRRTRIYRDVVL